MELLIIDDQSNLLQQLIVLSLLSSTLLNEEFIKD